MNNVPKISLQLHRDSKSEIVEYVLYNPYEIKINEGQYAVLKNHFLNTVKLYKFIIFVLNDY